jgi:hypothetical protein
VVASGDDVVVVTGEAVAAIRRVATRAEDSRFFILLRVWLFEYVSLIFVFVFLMLLCWRDSTKRCENHQLLILEFNIQLDCASRKYELFTITAFHQ